MAKIAGKDSSLLQISDAERSRAARIADLFSEEDLARHLQIMLRTHGELAYKQEQRFHLELGLLKLVHAQRLLPLEQLLSEAAPSAGTATGATPRLSVAAGSRNAPQPTRNPFAASPATRESARPSPFEADRARKTQPEEASSPDMAEGAHPFATSKMGTAAAADNGATSAALAEPANEAAVPAVAPDEVRDHALTALEDAGEKILASILEQGEWSVAGQQVVVRAPAPAKMLQMALNATAQRTLDSAASAVLGRPVKVRVEAGEETATPAATRPRPAATGTAHSRAAEDPVVRRMQEKFGAEIRSVIDQRSKR